MDGKSVCSGIAVHVRRIGKSHHRSYGSGIPVIGSRVGGIPEIVEEGGRGFLVPPGDEKALAEKFRWILNNPDKSREMGEAGRAFVARLFSTESYLKGYKQIFEMALPRNRTEEHAPSTL